MFYYRSKEDLVIMGNLLEGKLEGKKHEDGWIRFVERDGKKYHELTEIGMDLLETIEKLAESS